MINAVHDKRKHQVHVAHKHLLVDLKNILEWGTYLSLPASYEKKCNGKGKH